MRWVLATLSMSMLLASLGTSIANVGLPAMALAFDAPFEQLQWIVLAYLLAVTTLVVGAGRLGDLIGRRCLLLAGIALFTAASLACAFAANLSMLIAARVAQGAGAAAMMALTIPFVSETIPKARTGSAMGLLGTMSAIGTAFGPSVGGLLIAAFGWPALFVASVPLGLLTLLLGRRFLPADRPRSSVDRTRFDHSGTLLLALTLAAYALAMTTGQGRFGIDQLALLLMAVIGGAAFAMVEQRAAAPLLRLALFRNPVLATGFATSALVTTVVMATLVVGPFHLAGSLALDAASVGLVMSAGPIAAALVGVPAGRFVDRFGARRVVIGGLVAMAVGACTLAWMPTSIGVPGYIAPLIVLTAGYAIFQAANNTAVMTDVAADQRGVLSGLLNLSRNLGLVTGASAMGAVFAIGSGVTPVTTASPEAIAAGMKATFGVAAALVLIALLIAAPRTCEDLQTRQAGN